MCTIYTIHHTSLMLDHSITNTKPELRRNIRLLRQQLSRRQRSQQDRKINRALLLQVQKLRASSVSAFSPFDGEPDLRPALSAMAADNITLSLPVLDADAGISAAAARTMSS